MKRFSITLVFSSVMILILFLSGCVAKGEFVLKDGYGYLDSGDVNSARDRFESVISSSENPVILSKAYEGLGWVEIVSGNVEKAELNFIKALNENPNNDDAIYGNIICAWMTGNLDELKKRGEKFLKKVDKSYSFDKLHRFHSNWSDIAEIILASYIAFGEYEKAGGLIEELPVDQFIDSIRRAMKDGI